MSMTSRMKSDAGGALPPRTIASAATLVLPDEDNVCFVSGSVTVTSLTTPQFIRNRRILLIGAASAAVIFTNTNTLATAGQMYLQGADRTLNESDTLELFCQDDGTWIVLGGTAL